MTSWECPRCFFEDCRCGSEELARWDAQKAVDDLARAVLAQVPNRGDSMTSKPVPPKDRQRERLTNPRKGFVAPLSTYPKPVPVEGGGTTARGDRARDDEQGRLQSSSSATTPAPSPTPVPEPPKAATMGFDEFRAHFLSPNTSVWYCPVCNEEVTRTQEPRDYAAVEAVLSAHLEAHSKIEMLRALAEAQHPPVPEGSRLDLEKTQRNADDTLDVTKGTDRAWQGLAAARAGDVLALIDEVERLRAAYDDTQVEYAAPEAKPVPPTCAECGQDRGEHGWGHQEVQRAKGESVSACRAFIEAKPVPPTPVTVFRTSPVPEPEGGFGSVKIDCSDAFQPIVEPSERAAKPVSRAEPSPSPKEPMCEVCELPSRCLPLGECVKHPLARGELVVPTSFPPDRAESETQGVEVSERTEGGEESGPMDDVRDGLAVVAPSPPTSEVTEGLDLEAAMHMYRLERARANTLEAEVERLSRMRTVWTGERMSKAEALLAEYREAARAVVAARQEATRYAGCYYTVPVEVLGALTALLEGDDR